MQIFLGEFLGTCTLVLLGNGVVSNVLLEKSKGKNSGWIVIASGWGLAVSIALYLAGWISGGHLNPAVTLGLTIGGKSDWSLFPIYILGQLLGAMLGALLVWLAYRPHFDSTKDSSSLLSCFCTMPAINKPIWNVITEVIGTFVLVLGVFGISSPHNSMPASLSPFIFGLLVFSIGLSLGGPTGYAINPARDLGPRIMHALLPLTHKGSSDWRYSPIPALAPLAGAAIAAFVYLHLLSKLEPLAIFSR